MTAINAYLAADRVHFFSDGGHFAGRRLCHLGGKVLSLPAYDAAMAYSGPSAGAPALLGEIERSGAPTLGDLLNRLPVLVAAANRKARVGSHPFSAIVAGVHGGMACGLAIEEGGACHFLAPGSFIRSLATDVDFEPEDIAASGLAMMEDQRRHGVVAGWCQHSVIGRDKFRSRILRRWPEAVAGSSAPTVQAKIGDLEVDTINFAGQSVTGAVSGASSITVPNAPGFPVILTASCRWTYEGAAAGSTGSLALTIRRQSDSKLIATNTTGRGGVGTFGPYGFSVGGIDDNPPSSNVAYTLTVATSGTGGPPPGQIFVTNPLLTGVYTKK